MTGADQQGPAITLGQDSRITPCGSWLRRYRLDELPQLWNVLKGEMSIVGPRPEAPQYVEKYSPEQRQVLTVKPGLTGITQLDYKDESTLLTGPDWEERYLTQVMPAKLVLDLQYVQSRSFGGDLKIIFKTLYRLVNPYTQENQPRIRGRHLFLFDALLIMLAYILSFALRFDNLTFWIEFLQYTRILFFFLAIKLIVFYLFGLYRRVWRYASIRELTAIFGAVTVGSTIVGGLTLFFWVLPIPWSPVRGFPRSVLGIDWLLTLLMIGGSRFTLRALAEFSPPANPQLMPVHQTTGLKRAFIIGSGQSVARLARELHRLPPPGYTIAGLITESGEQVGLSIHGFPILGKVADLAQLIDKHTVNELIIAAPEMGGALTRRVLAETHQANVSIKTLPTTFELIEGGGGLSGLRDIKIEDLLRRAPITTDVNQIAGLITGQTIMITGAGGSIGSELCRQISRFGPQNVILLGHGENSIFNALQEQRLHFPTVNFIPVISDIRDFGRMSRLLATHQPDVIFHAAAHKHVTLMELNPEEGVINNILGTKVLLEAAEAFDIPRLVMISTDKAVDPTSIMGTTKRVAEMIVQGIARRSRHNYVAVRFGNVLGSRGSVIPLFQKQIAEGGPVTVTHPDVTRFFMTIPEAVQLVLQAAILGTSGEIFVLNMGRPVRILDLAHDLIRLSGLQPEVDIAITFTGLKPGEKLHEILVTDIEGPAATQHQKITVVPPVTKPNPEFWQQVDNLISAAYRGDTEAVRRMLQQIAPGASFKNGIPS